MTTGFFETPKVYEPPRMEYRQDDVKIVWAVPCGDTDKRWMIYLNEKLCQDLGLPNTLNGRMFDASEQDTRKWVKGLGQVFSFWAEQSR